ncbi:hypothetical protein D9756_007129 [Leucocoprinus leucothites]|uniref:Protein kinase domain-containing protein n=1 Tax=Leucocoprinus leucothites TaxID=201217 RepID=A0A8H5D6K0_9AGAR|nr:hypothetical protein D9756_007129 [Leucoagaricus leucothites]
MNDKTAEQDLENFETAEMTSSTAHKIDSDRIIYVSRRLVPQKYSYGLPVLCDFGEAQFGEFDYLPDIQPYQYRAPEVILDIPWDEKVDIWSVGVMAWDLLGNGNLFRTTGGPEDVQDNIYIYHLAHMIALLVPPPKDFLRRTKDRLWGWFDGDGIWKGAAEIPNSSPESTETVLQGEDKVLFLNFARKMLKWKPEERSTTKELIDDPWLNSD